MAEGSSRFSSWIFVKILRLKFGDNLKLNFGQDLEVDVWSGRPVGTKSQLNPKWGAPFNASWKCLPTPVWPDRDDFIEVNFENISPKMRNNFVKRPLGNARSHAAGSVNPKNTPYDAHSANQMWKETFQEWWCFYCYQMLLHSTPPPFRHIFPFWKSPSHFNSKMLEVLLLLLISIQHHRREEKPLLATYTNPLFISCLWYCTMGRMRAQTTAARRR